MQTILNRMYPLLLGIFLLQLSCSKFGTNTPDSDAAFNFDVKYTDEMPETSLMYSGYQRLCKNQSAMSKTSAQKEVTRGHILVIDFSKYEDMQAFRETEDYLKFLETEREIEDDSLLNWSQWVNAYEENFNIITNQSFSVDGDTVILDITGVTGLNYFVLALVDNDLIRYTGDDHGHGVAGESETVTIWMTEWDPYESPEPEPTDTRFEVIATISLGENPDIPVLSQNEDYLYVINSIGADAYVSVISTVSNIVDQTIRVGSSYCWAKSAALSPDGSFLWVPIKNNDRIDIISTATHTLIDSIVITQQHLDFRIDEVAFSADGRTAFAVSADAEDGVFIDVDSRQVIASIDMNSDYANHVIGDMNNEFFYVSDAHGDAIYVVSIQDRDVHKDISTGDSPAKPTLTPDGTQLYVPNSGYNNEGNELVHVIDINTLSISGAISIEGSPEACTFTSDGQYCFIPNGYDLVTILEKGAGEVAEITVGRNPYEGSISPDDNYYFSPSWDDGVLSVISVETQALLEHIQVGSSPQKPVITSDGTIYTANYNSNSISVIREKQL